MGPRNSLLAVPEGTAPPTQLPDEFHSRVTVCEIIDSPQFPRYVYLVKSYLLTECTDDDRYNAEQCPYFEYRTHRTYSSARDDPQIHGPASFGSTTFPHLPLTYTGRIKGSVYSTDGVFCIRCLLWPRQAANWSTRQRLYCWPDSATVDRVVSSGCDVVPVAHRLCRQHELLSECQHRLSFSRAEVVLINSWIPVQQIVYHMLRVFIKMQELTDSTNNAGEFTNYHVKTLMLWACELKPRSWWTEDLDVVRICVELLHILAVWLDGSSCANYFITKCNLLDCCNTKRIAGKLMLITEQWLAEWFINIYVRKCAHIFEESLSPLFADLSTTAKIQNAVSGVVHLRLLTSNVVCCFHFENAILLITDLVSYKSITVRSRLYWMRVIEQIDQRLSAYFIAITLLHVARKITENSLTDELLDVLAMTRLKSNDARRWISARHSSVLSLSQAVVLMKVVAKDSRSTVQLIEIELSKAYLYRALRCKDSDRDSIYCLANVYLAVLYYVTGHYKTAIDHCSLVTSSHDHSRCSSHVVRGEYLPKVDDDIDDVLGLSVFYQYLRTAALNQQVTKVTPHNSAFTTELFANYVHLKCLLAEKCQMLSCMPSLASEIQRYRKCVSEHTAVFITDVLVFCLASRTQYAAHDRGLCPTKDHTKPMMIMPCRPNTPELVELLQQSAVEHLTELRQLESQEFNSIRLGFVHTGEIVTTDFEALYAYKCGEYQRCLQLSMHNVRTRLVGDRCMLTPLICPYPEFIQLMDDNIVSLIGLITIVDKTMRDFAPVDQLSLSLYLMSQCQMKLHHSWTILAATLNHVQVVRRKFLCQQTTLVELVLTLTERKMQSYLVILRL